MKQVKVIVTGPVGSGKTFIAGLIAQSLRDHGVGSVIQDHGTDGDPHRDQATIDRLIEEVAPHIEVNINEVNTLRKDL